MLPLVVRLAAVDTGKALQPVRVRLAGGSY